MGDCLLILFLFYPINSLINSAALRNDDADDSDAEIEAIDQENEERHIAKRVSGQEKDPKKERLPTGRIVGIIRRNWRT